MAKVTLENARKHWLFNLTESALEIGAKIQDYVHAELLKLVQGIAEGDLDKKALTDAVRTMTQDFITALVDTGKINELDWDANGRCTIHKVVTVRQTKDGYQATMTGMWKHGRTAFQRKLNDSNEATARKWLAECTPTEMLEYGRQLASEAAEVREAEKRVAEEKAKRNGEDVDGNPLNPESVGSGEKEVKPFKWIGEIVGAINDLRKFLFLNWMYISATAGHDICEAIRKVQAEMETAVSKQREGEKAGTREAVSEADAPDDGTAAPVLDVTDEAKAS